MFTFCARRRRDWYKSSTHCNTLPDNCNALQRTATHCNALQHSATHCNTLQHTATQLQCSATRQRHRRRVAHNLTALVVSWPCSITASRRQCSTACNSVWQWVTVCCCVLQCAAQCCCTVLHCTALCSRVLQCVAECCSALQFDALCCSVLQCVAVWHDSCL